MRVRTQAEIDAIIVRAKQNNVNRMLTYGSALNKGVAKAPYLKMQLVLIHSAESDLATLDQKNIYVDILLKNNLASATASQLGAYNLLNPEL